MKQPIVLLLLALGLSTAAHADNSLSIAVASNFRATAEEISEAFTKDLGIQVRLSSGSTGKLYAQIVNGAPYDIFLAADMKRPWLLAESGEGMGGSLQRYVDGKIVLVSADREFEESDCLRALTDGSYKRLAIANPATAPYGAAAKAFLEAAGLWDDAEAKLIRGENISQTFQFVVTGNATLGIVSASQLTGARRVSDISCRHAIDISDHSLLQQGGIILRRSEMLDEARLFMDFLRSETAKSLMTTHGYEVPTA